MAKSRYRYFVDTLATNVQKFIQIGHADYIFLFSNTGAAATLMVSFDDEEFQALPVGVSLKTEPFSKVTIRNTDTGSTTAVYAIGFGNIDFNALLISGTIVTNPSSTAFTSPAPVTVTTTAAILIAANANRREAIISNNGIAGEVVWVGDINVSASGKRGIPIANGEKIVLSTQGLIWADADAGTPSVSYIETTGT